MATKQSLIIVHGMGEHTEASFKKEITDSLNYSLKLYDDWKDKKIENLIDIVHFQNRRVPRLEPVGPDLTLLERFSAGVGRRQCSDEITAFGDNGKVQGEQRFIVVSESFQSFLESLVALRQQGINGNFLRHLLVSPYLV